MTAQYFSDTGEVSCAASCTDIYILLYFSFFYVKMSKPMKPTEQKGPQKDAPAVAENRSRNCPLVLLAVSKQKR